MLPNLNSSNDAIFWTTEAGLSLIDRAAGCRLCWILMGCSVGLGDGRVMLGYNWNISSVLPERVTCVA